VATQALATEVKNKHSRDLLAHPNVSGVGTARTADGDWVIDVHVEAGSGGQPELPEHLDGVPVRVIADGPYRAGPARA
jgi:hypothetical protein